VTYVIINCDKYFDHVTQRAECRVVNVEEMGKHVEKTICTDVPQAI
jgi:hypothetical protein